MSEARDRIAIALQCRDCASVPKAADAGKRHKDARGREIQTMHNGLRVYADGHYGTWNCEVIEQLGGHHEPQEEWVFHHVVQHIAEGGTMLEFGSFWAYYSMWFQLRVPGARNYMVEPIADMLEVGRQNFQLNGMRGNFKLGSVGARSIPQVEFHNWDGSVSQIPQYGVDDFMKAEKLEHLAILHADIQGAEFRMLKGARRALKERAIDYIFISSHSQELHRKCLWLLADHGYLTLASHTLDESYSVDGLIAARSPNTDPLQVAVSKRKPPLRRLLKHAFDHPKHRLRYRRDLRQPEA